MLLDNTLQRQRDILYQLSCLPRKIVGLHGNENVTDFVMYELCAEHCFNLDKAAYFVDNPDFDCLKGIAGHARSERFSPSSDDIWRDPQAFTNHMRKSPFNSAVRGFSHESMKKRGTTDDDIAKTVAQAIGITCHGFFSWDMKHDNHGIFIFESSCALDQDVKSHLVDGLALFSFCPVF